MPPRLYGSRDKVIQGAQAVQAAQAVKAVISGTSRKLWSPQLHRSAVQRGMLVVHLVALRGSSQLCVPCTSTFFILFAAPVESAFFPFVMIYHGGDGPTGGLVGRYVPVLAATDCSDSCLQVCFFQRSSSPASNDNELTGALVKNECTDRDGTGQTRTDNQLTLL